ncbi:endonuclease MutS2 [Kroppenstedtia pulmonis]|uniref:Endonuclease MutS2 n=1 Tax=Kroppenstedtia pulmonis TaxID=1380685 RepID=A0A7D4CEP5_9BACL|nr:endonuclease MutS2 [Kroppenstedtia pulmonis]QKG84014.1 endonuclease MutS2 [Kroppenstedtia pulmonis]
MDRNKLHTLEFHRVLEILESLASSETGRKKIKTLTPSANEEEVRHLLRSTAEGMDLIRLRGDLSLEGVRDIRNAVRRAEIGGILHTGELLAVSDLAEAEKNVRRMVTELDEEKAPLPIWRELTERLEELFPLAREIRKSIDDEGQVMSSASPNLARIRRSIHQLQGGIRSSLDQILRNSQYQKMLQDPIVTQRNNRYVIPVKQEYRHAFGGIVHDQSASGQTLFIEPKVVVDQNNRLKELELEEEREVERILGELTIRVQEYASPLLHNLGILTEMDVVMSKARLGKKIKGVCPRIEKDGVISLKKARHPLIDEESVVPVDVELGKDYQGIIVTGPNTGGKTVFLKTVGLLSLMAQCGMPIPAEEGSGLPVFSGIYADIGDEQSIEQNLSTFSSHMTNIIRIMEQLDEKSLVLFDELGAGTDPTEGAALAVSILKEVLSKGCQVLATTHYNELKVFAHNHPDVLNASVEFDVETLRPTYRLLTGVPGRSNAFEIALRLGLSSHVVDVARSHLSKEENQLEEMITSLTADRKMAEEERNEAESLRKEAEKLHQELQRQWALLEEEKERLQEAARRDARSIVSRAKREADEVLKELRDWARQKPAQVKEHQLIAMKKRLDEAQPEPVRTWKSGKGDENRQIQVGDEVLVRTLGQKGQVVDQTGQKEFQVQIGFMKMKVKREDLEWQRSAHTEKTEGSTSYHRQSHHVRHELDLRGKMVDEAVPEVDKYLDDAMLAGYQQVSLIHGKGTGALRVGVQKFLQRHPRVKGYRLGGQGEGGSGVTVVELH